MKVEKSKVRRGITLATLGMGLVVNGWLVGMAVKTAGRAKKEGGGDVVCNVFRCEDSAFERYFLLMCLSTKDCSGGRQPASTHRKEFSSEVLSIHRRVRVSKG